MFKSWHIIKQKWGASSRVQMSLTWRQSLFSRALVIEKQQHRQWRSRGRSACNPRSPTRRVLEITDSHQPAPVPQVQHLPREGRSLWCLHKKGTSTISCPGMTMLDLTMSYCFKNTHFTPSTVAIIKGRTITSIGRDVEMLEHWYLATLVHCYWEFEMVQPPWKRVWQFFKKLHVELPYNPVILPLGMYPQRIENIISHKNIHTNVIAALFGITPKWKPPKCPWLTNG